MHGMQALDRNGFVSMAVHYHPDNPSKNHHLVISRLQSVAMPTEVRIHAWLVLIEIARSRDANFKIVSSDKCSLKWPFNSFQHSILVTPWWTNINVLRHSINL